MALNSSGPLSIAGSTAGQSIELEFQGTSTNQLSMSQLYRGGGIVPNASVNTAVPTSGQIAIGNFYGASNRIALSQTISSNVQNYNIYNSRPGGYVAGITDLTLTVNAVIGSSSTGSFALTIGSFASGDTVTIINNSYIVGCGGNGGYGGGADATGNPGAGAGPALNANRAVTIYNYGVIGGGGGGGGGTGGTTTGDGGYGFVGHQGQGGGGGAGNNVGAAGNGAAAGSLTGGGGGAGAYYAGSGSYAWYMPAGGAGGSLGNGGAGGGGPSISWYYNAYGGARSYGGGGGAAGACTSGNSNITWAVVGTRYGALN